MKTQPGVQVSLRAAVTVMLVCVMGAACTPSTPAPTGPNLVTTVALTPTNAALPHVVSLVGRATDFPASTSYSLRVVAKDRRTGQVVHTYNGPSNSDGTFSKWLQPALFSVVEAGGTSTIDVELTTTLTSESATASKTDVAVLSWTTPTSPTTGSMTSTPPAYQAMSATSTACAPVGTAVRINATGAITRGSAFFLVATTPTFGAGAVALDPSGVATLTTTSPCFAVVVLRSDFTGQLSGTLNYTVTWPAP